MCCVKESVSLDPKLCGSAVHIVWMKVVLETEMNCEKRTPEVLLYTRDVRSTEKYVRDALLSYQSTLSRPQGIQHRPADTSDSNHSRLVNALRAAYTTFSHTRCGCPDAVPLDLRIRQMEVQSHRIPEHATSHQQKRATRTWVQ